MKVQIDSDRCRGHGRCYDLAPDLFGADEEGYGQVLDDGMVPLDSEREARLAAAGHEVRSEPGPLPMSSTASPAWRPSSARTLCLRAATIGDMYCAAICCEAALLNWS